MLIQRILKKKAHTQNRNNQNEINILNIYFQIDTFKYKFKKHVYFEEKKQQQKQQKHMNMCMHILADELKPCVEEIQWNNNGFDAIFTIRTYKHPTSTGLMCCEYHCCQFGCYCNATATCYQYYKMITVCEFFLHLKIPFINTA